MEPLLPLAPPQLGLYVHLPFCPSRCPYCDFASQPFAPALARALVPALLEHLRGQAPRAGGRTLDHLYLGGGTPSLWPVKELARLIQAVRELIGLGPQAEVTMEANPGTLSARKLELLRQAGVNRLSLGAQSFQPAILAALGRRHTPHDTRRAAHAAREAGFASLSLDLIYGLPGQDLGLARADLEAALACEPDHLSLYELTLAADTPFGRRYRPGRPPLPSEDEVLAMEDQALALLEGSGLMRYEVSNFARPGQKCRHNQSTWRGGDYLAIGPAAHGHLAGRRWAWLSDPGQYLAALARGQEPLAFSEDLAPEQRTLELILLGLRTKEGLSLAALEGLLRDDPRRVYAVPMARMEEMGWAKLTQTHLRPTGLGLRMADSAAGMFV